MQKIRSVPDAVLHGPKLPLLAGGDHRSKQLGPVVPYINIGPASHRFIDMVIMGEGEIPLLNLVRYLKKGGSPANVKGVAYKHGKLIHLNPEENKRIDLNTLPISLLDLNSSLIVNGLLKLVLISFNTLVGYILDGTHPSAF